MIIATKVIISIENLHLLVLRRKEKANLCHITAQACTKTCFFKKSPNRISTKVLPFAVRTMFAYPNGIELVHGLLNQFGVVGEDACFEIARTLSFHADACAGEVGAADVSHLAIENQNLEMYPRTERPFKAIKQSRVFVEVLAEGWTRLLGMDETDFDSFFNKLSQDSKEGLRLRADFDIKVFDVGGANPNASFHLGDTGKDFGVMSFITDEF